jgi:hypothetical protein
VGDLHLMGAGSGPVDIHALNETHAGASEVLPYQPADTGGAVKVVQATLHAFSGNGLLSAPPEGDGHQTRVAVERAKTSHHTSTLKEACSATNTERVLIPVATADTFSPRQLSPHKPPGAPSLDSVKASLQARRWKADSVRAARLLAAYQIEEGSDQTLPARSFRILGFRPEEQLLEAVHTERSVKSIRSCILCQRPKPYLPKPCQAVAQLARNSVKSILRGSMLAGINYNMLSSLMNMLLFFAVQGALIKSFVGFDLPIELVAAVLLALVAATTVSMELAQAVVLWRWSHMAQVKYGPKKSSLLVRARSVAHSTKQRISHAARSVQASVKRTVNVSRKPELRRPVATEPVREPDLRKRQNSSPPKVTHYFNPLRQ